MKLLLCILILSGSLEVRGMQKYVSLINFPSIKRAEQAILAHKRVSYPLTHRNYTLPKVLTEQDLQAHTVQEKSNLLAQALLNNDVSTIFTIIGNKPATGDILNAFYRSPDKNSPVWHLAIDRAYITGNIIYQSFIYFMVENGASLSLEDTNGKNGYQLATFYQQQLTSPVENKDLSKIVLLEQIKHLLVQENRPKMLE